MVLRTLTASTASQLASAANGVSTPSRACACCAAARRTLQLTPAPDLSLFTDGNPPSRADETNLAWRAADLLRKTCGIREGARIALHKSIPMGAGLGGGSADAAGVLFGLNRLWGTGLSLSDLESLGLQLGADIPFCLRGGLTRTTGIGDRMENLSCGRLYPLIVIQPCRGLSTREVFGAFHQDEVAEHPDTETAVRALEEGDLEPLRRSLKNVLQPVSVRMRPEIGRCIRKLKESGAEVSLMTGSGSAVFGVFRTPARARTAFSSLVHQWPSAFLTRTCLTSLEIERV